MSDERKTALLLMIVLGLFLAVASGALVGLHLMERSSGLLETQSIESLKNALKANPDNPALLETIRQNDLQLRQTHFQNRARFQWGGWMLLVAGIAWLASARWFMALGVKPLPVPPEGPPADEKPVRAAGVVALSGSAVLIILLLAAAFWTPKLPTGEPQGAAPASTAPEATIESTPAAPIAEGDARIPDPDEWRRNWPGFRGPDGIGAAVADADWPTSWSVELSHNVIWAVDVPAHGKSSPVVWNDRLFLTGGEDNHHILCFDVSDGALLWDLPFEIPADFDPEGIRDFAGVSAPTPVTDGQRVFAMFPSGLLAAADFAGNPVWTKNLGPIDSMYGFSASPIYFEGTVILQFDVGGDPDANLSRLIAFDAASGDVAWETPRDVPNSWASPALIRMDDHAELITCADPWVIAYDPATGEELWRVDGLGGDVAPSPAWGGGLVFAAQEGADLLAIRPGGSGDVTESHVVWTSWEGLPDMASPVAGDTRLLQIDSAGGVVCFDIATGEMAWDAFLPTVATASPVLAGGRVYIFMDNGSAIIANLNDAEAPLSSAGAVADRIEATPAFVDGRIYIRGESRLFCIGGPEP